jgi:hypothetical protein
VPKDRPAIGNLMTLFNFARPDFATVRMATHAMPAGNASAPVITNLQR